MSLDVAPVYVRMYDLTLWLFERSMRFPRVQRFVLAQRLQQAAFEATAALATAALDRSERLAALARADRALTELRVALRLCGDLGLLSGGQTEHADRELAEIGRMLGGWRRHVASSHAGPP